LIKTFVDLLEVKRTEVKDYQMKYTVGLEKLTATEQSVEGMKQEIIALQPIIEDKTRDAKELIIIVTKEEADANEQREIVDKDASKAQIAADKANDIKKECEGILEEALPKLKKAENALKNISAPMIVEIKNLLKPGPAVVDCLSFVCILFGIKPERVKNKETDKYEMSYWGPAQTMMKDKFIEKLKAFKKEDLTEKTIEAVKKYYDDPIVGDEKQMMAKSVAAANLASWACAMYDY